MKSDADRDWTTNLQPAALATNTQFKRSTRYTLFYLVHNIKKVKRLPVTKKEKEYLGPFVVDSVTQSHLITRKILAVIPLPKFLSTFLGYTTREKTKSKFCSSKYYPEYYSITHMGVNPGGDGGDASPPLFGVGGTPILIVPPTFCQGWIQV